MDHSQANSPDDVVGLDAEHDGSPVPMQHQIGSDDAQAHGSHTSCVDVFDQAISDVERSVEEISPRKRCGDVIGVVAEQPLAQHTAETAAHAFQTVRAATDTLGKTLTPMKHPNGMTQKLQT